MAERENMKSIYEKETDDFIQIVSSTLMNYALYNLIPEAFGSNESGFNLWATEMVHMMETR